MDKYYSPKLGDNYTRIKLFRPHSSSRLDVDAKELLRDWEVEMWIAIIFTGWNWCRYDHYIHNHGEIYDVIPFQNSYDIS